MRLKVPSVLLCAALLPAVASADVSVPRVFGDRMVIQRDVSVPVWGRASPGEAVAVRFAGQDKHTTADPSGVWRVTLDKLQASSEPRDLVVAGANTLTFRDVLVGEVWLCAGQSNMEMALGVPAAAAQPESAYDPELARALPTMSYPRLRLFKVSQKSRETGDLQSDRGWAEARGAALAEFSAAGFFFAREVQTALDVPVGLVLSAWGGSRLEEWISDADYAPLEHILGAEHAGTFERNADIVSRNYDVMVAPMAPFPFRGVLWYQGETNVISYADGVGYADKFFALVKSWRAAWRAPDLPFYAVQLAPLAYEQFRRAPEDLPRFWEAQRLATTVPHTFLVPIGDTVDDVRNVHPGKKSVVGHRLASQALAATYGRTDLATNGPVFRGVEFRGAVARIVFDGAAGGLVISDGAPPTDFEVAGADGRFVAATATIRGEAIEVTASGVAQPTAVRFGWKDTARPNLRNKAGWPAYPFRSDGPAWSPKSAAE